jgi:hypothetical protein
MTGTLEGNIPPEVNATLNRPLEDPERQARKEQMLTSGRMALDMFLENATHSIKRALHLTEQPTADQISQYIQTTEHGDILIHTGINLRVSIRAKEILEHSEGLAYLRSKMQGEQ